MLLSLYKLLLHLHPAAFRQRFGDEMLEVFQSAHGPYTAIFLVGDGLRSLVRQWSVRAEFLQPHLTATTSDSPAHVPLFLTLDERGPRRSALLSGAVLALTTFFIVTTVINYGWDARRFLVGAHYPRPDVLPVARNSVAGTDLDTTLKIRPLPDDPWRAIAAVYFKIIRVLDVLDSDKNLIISPWESFTAPAALRRLDANHDGKLSAEECGFFLGPNAPVSPDVAAHARLAFMRENPVLAALDADHNGEISASEIANSSHALITLDANGDGSLTPDELIPDQISSQAAMILTKVDANGDGRISRSEWMSQDDPTLANLLQSADRNRDGVVTPKELKNELRLLTEQKREAEAAQQAAGLR